MSGPGAADALVQRILDGGAPLPLRQAAARGALPLPRAILARLHVHLLQDPEEQIRSSAKESLDALGTEAIGGILSDPTCTAEVLTHFAHRASRDLSLAERLAFHPSVNASALSVLASDGSAPVIDLVLTNQEKLLASPGILDRLTTNPALRPDQRGKILDILDRLSKEGPSVEAVLAEVENVSPEEAARLLEVDVGELYAASEILGGEEFERAEDPVLRSAYQRIVKLGPGQKAMLAMKGGRDERMILIRDTNKVVALSVLKNPRLTEQDVEEIARLRSVCEEVLRAVGGTRDWSKRYSVVTALVRNPRTPQGISLNFVSRLAIQDLKDLTRDRNIPELIRRAAKKTYDLRTQNKVSSLKKK
jgi:hypothetical protein